MTNLENTAKNATSLALNWTEISLPGYWHGIAYGRGVYVTVSSLSQKVAYSYNGQDWTIEDLAGGFNRVNYQNGYFIATGANGATARSTDGTRWETNFPNQTKYISDVAWGNNQYVAVGDGIYATSTNALNWTYGSFEHIARFIQYNTNTRKFIATGYEIAITSTDGRNWDSQFVQGNFYGLAYGAGKYVTTGDYSLATSTDGTTWTTHPLLGVFHGVIYDGQKFITVGMNEIAYSTDGITWDERTSVSETLYNIAYNADRKEYIAVGHNKIFYSNGQ